MTHSTEHDQRHLKISFQGLTPSEADRAAQELESFLTSRIGAGGSIQRERISPITQDLGATLVLVLGTPAAYALAKGVHDYIAKRGNRVVISTSNGSILATGDAAKNLDVTKAAEAITRLD